MISNLVILRHKQWLLCQSLFSDDAVVRVLDMDTSALPMHLDSVPVKRFSWPTPVGLYKVGIEEPARDLFDQALLKAGIKLPKSVEIDAAALIEDDRNVSSWPGAMTPHNCPHCENESLHVSGIETTLEQVSLYNREISGSFYWEDCENHGIHTFVNGKIIVALECLKCCERYLLADEKMLQIRNES